MISLRLLRGAIILNARAAAMPVMSCSTAAVTHDIPVDLSNCPAANVTRSIIMYTNTRFASAILNIVFWTATTHARATSPWVQKAAKAEPVA